MHTMIFVVGDDPIGQLTPDMDGIRWHRSELAAEIEHADVPVSPDWVGIGGRYTGMLIPKPGATGKLVGWTMPAVDAWMENMVAESAPGATFQRGGARSDRRGVDQISAADVDWRATSAEADRMPRAVVVDGTWHDSFAGLSTYEKAALMTAGLPVRRRYALSMRIATWHAQRKLRRFYRETFGPAMACAEQRGALVTVVDIHE